MSRNRMLKSGDLLLVDRRTLLAGLASSSALALAGCESNPITGRSQLMIVSDEKLARMSRVTWDEINKVSVRHTNTRVNQQVEAIGKRCVDAADQGHRDWEFAVFEDPTVNAFVLPGGQVAFYTGFLDMAKNDDQVAAVMGHEIGHVVGRHGAERASQGLLAELGVSFAALLLGNDSTHRADLAAALGAGITFGIILPYSRNHEYEADSLGLQYMHTAGYDPQEAVNLWQSMNELGSSQPLEFLSTHPAPANRMRRLQEQVDQLA